MAVSGLVVDSPTVNSPAPRTAFKPLKLSSKPTHWDGVKPKTSAPFK